MDFTNKNAIQMFSTNATDMYASIKGKIRHFNEKFSGTVSGTDISGRPLSLDPSEYSKVLDVVVQRGRVSNDQFDQIQRAIGFGRANGVTVRIVEIP